LHHSSFDLHFLELEFPTSVNDASTLLERMKDIRSAYLLALQKNGHLFDYLVRCLQRAVSSANRHLRTFTYLSFYVLYPFGILIGIVGQVAGVKSAGGE